MKTFIYRILLFLISTFIVIGILFIGTNLIIRKKSNFKLHTLTHNLIFGHSHPERAFNDSLILNFKNLSQSRQSYFYSYIKIKKVLSQNNDIRNIFIEYNNKNITKIMDSWIWDDFSISSKSLYLPFLEKSDLVLLYKKNKNALLRGFSKSFRNNLMNILLFNYDYTNKIGGYRWEEGSISNSKLTRKKNNQETGLSLVNIDYLEKIVKYCNQKNINIYFIRTPQHKKYPWLNNEQEFFEIKNTRFKKVKFLDFNKFPLDDSEFADFGHLNYKGAKRFSIWFNDLIKDSLLRKNNMQKFIDMEIKKVQLPVE